MMEAQRGPFDIDWGFWIMLAVILFVSAISVVALLTLRRRPMDEIPRFLWTLLIVFMPVLGAIIFCIVHPENLPDVERKYI